jgi:hypothetical protein
MDQKLIQKASSNMSSFREDILSILAKSSSLEEATISIEAIPLPTLEDMIKRKRSKNSVPTDERCSARRASGERCTRRKKEGSDCCGTHCKGIPHGVISDIEQVRPHTKVEVWAEDFNGIVHYIDSQGNVYKTEDVLKNKPNPTVYAKWAKEGGVYTIKSS